MMLWLAAACGIGLLALGFVQALAMRRFIQLIGSPNPAETWDNPPKACVFLTLRGADPDLEDALVRLFQQDYPSYDVKIVVDRRDDPAWPVVMRAIERAQANNVEVNPLRERPPECSLQCAGLIQLARSVPADAGVVVLADGDLLPHPTWLRELVSPLKNPEVAAAFGNRWYMPEEGRWGSLVRHIWSQWAVVVMWIARMPWGGSLAIRAEEYRKADVPGLWGRGLVSDAFLPDALAPLGKRVEFVPSLLMVNREECGLPFCFNFLMRQLLWTRLYHSRWPIVVFHGLLTTLIPVAALVGIAATIWMSQWLALTVFASSFVAYVALMITVGSIQEVAVEDAIAKRGEAWYWRTPRVAMRLAGAAVLTQIVQFAAMVAALTVRDVRWRGVVYQINGPWDVHRTEQQAEPILQLTPADGRTSL